MRKTCFARGGSAIIGTMEDRQSGRSGYLLREAAGAWWLLHLAQEGTEYERPLRLNQSGAVAVSAVLAGGGVAEAARALCDTYQIPWEQALSDAKDLLVSTGLEASL